MMRSVKQYAPTSNTRLEVLTSLVLRVHLMFAILIVFSASGLSQDAASHAEFWKSDLQPFLTKYCYDCHSGDGAESDIDFEQYDASSVLGEQRVRWNQIRGMIEIGAMPPADYDPLPSREEREKIANWIDRRINTVDCQVTNDPGRVTMRRLNNAEYDNAVRDLLKIDFKPSELLGFPSDGVGNGFDNQGDVLTLSPLQLEKYLQAAKAIASKVIIDDKKAFYRQRKDLPSLYREDEAFEEFLSTDGQYDFSARLKFEEKVEEPIPVEVLIDGEVVDTWQVTDDRKTFSTTNELAAGVHRVGLRFVTDPGSEAKRYRRRVDVDYIELKGPSEGDPALPEYYTNLFVAEPSDELSIEDAADQIFRPLIRKAFRREPKPIDMERVVGLVKMAVEQGEKFDAAVGYGLQSILVSPQFLFRVEPEVAKTAKGEAEEQPLEQYALATRLAFFLWSSLPDEELLDLAAQGKLNDAAVLNNQVTRMLQDERSAALVSRFFSQFLGLGSLQEVNPDAGRFPIWNDRLRKAVVRETELFCEEIVREDHSLNVLLNGDYTYVNPRMAELYGLEFEGQSPVDLYKQGPGYKRSVTADRRAEYKHEDKWIRVKLPDGRRGVLTQASILTLTSNPTTTSPVKRGKWILESILGDPPPPAPPNVPSFEETQEGHKQLSLREQLAIHRENPSCASCHNVMDPLGLGFENFNTIGQWRDRDGKHPIDAAGELADGRKFNGALELVQLLESRQPEIFRHFADKLLTFAIGRGLEPYDNCAIDEIMSRAEAENYRMSAFIRAIVDSDPFMKRRPAEPSVETASK